MFFSVVVPVYNVEKYLKTCIDSILNQTFKDFELILVDDGSTDSSPQICDEYAKNDVRIRVLHKPNGGLSDARNTGLKSSCGKYLIFIDSDDYWDDNCSLEKINKLILSNNADVVTWRFKKYIEDDLRIENVGFDLPSEYDYSALIKSKNLVVSAWNKAINRKLFEENDLMFREGVFSEDVEWCARLLIVSKSFLPSNLNFYVYRQRKGSITHSIKEKNINDLKSHIENVEQKISCLDVDKKELLSRFIAEEFSNFVVTLSNYEKYQTEIKWVKKHRYLLSYATTKKSKILKLMFNFLGVRASIKFIKIIRR